MNSKILAVDIGTSSIKAGIIDSSGLLLSWQRVSYDDIDGDIYNWKTEYWVLSFKKAVAELMLSDEIDAVVFSGNGPTIIPLDESGRYMQEALLWLDNNKTDIPQCRSFYLPKALWYKENRPEQYRNISYFLNLSGFFPYLLTGEIKTPLPNDEFEPYIWDRTCIAKTSLDAAKFPQFVKTGELVGYVNASGEKDFGIREGVPVFAGANDYLMTLLGTGAVFQGAVCDRAGTSEGINYCSTESISCENLRSLPHIIPGFYNISGVLASSGRIFEWFRKLSGQGNRSYLSIVRDIGRVVNNEDNLYFFPSLKRGSVWQFSGGAFVGLEPRHGIPETGSAVVKSIGFSVRDVISQMEACSFRIEEIRLSGGQARNPLWNQMKSDMIGKKILVPEIFDGELLGCACAAFKGLGKYSSLSEASINMVRIKDVYTPDKKAYDSFTRLFDKYSLIARRIESLAGNL